MSIHHNVVFVDGKVDAVTFATGTGGTLAGVSMFLKSKNPKIKAILADPDVSIIIMLNQVENTCSKFEML